MIGLSPNLSRNRKGVQQASPNNSFNESFGCNSPSGASGILPNLKNKAYHKSILVDEPLNIQTSGKFSRMQKSPPPQLHSAKHKDSQYIYLTTNYFDKMDMHGKSKNINT